MSPHAQSTHLAWGHPGFPCLSLVFCVLTSGGWMWMTRKRSPSRETKTQACPALCGVSNQHQAGSVVEVELRVARVAWHGFLSRDWKDLNIPYSNRELKSPSTLKQILSLLCSARAEERNFAFCQQKARVTAHNKVRNMSLKAEYA